MFQRGSWSCGLLLITVFTGCDVSNPAKGPDRKVLAPPGIAPVGFDLQDAGRAAPQQPVQQAAAQPQGGPVQQPVQQPMQPQQAAPVNDGKGIIGKSTNQVSEMRPLMAQNPNLKIIDNKAAGDDPLTFACSAYISLRSRASTLGFEAALKQHRIVEMRNLTYQEFINMMKENHVEFTTLYAWQVYAYDPQDGRLVILEDATLKPR
ncbi:MAG: hypothetical protein JWM11_4041 [Planctomycetaceae bacterium]|nr:hypothetical protein [Planctomycetaceae bacterium]